MAITRLSGQGSNGSSTSYTALAPSAGTPTGTFRLASFYWHGTGTITAPAAWTPVLAPTALQGGYLCCYRRWHTDGDGSSTFTKSSTGALVGRITNLAGVDPTNPIDVAPVTTSQGATGTVYNPVPALTTVTPGAWVMWWLVAGLVQTSTRTFTLGSGGWTGETSVIYSATQGLNGLGAYQEYNQPGATGARTATYTITSAFRGFALALRPAGSTSGGRTGDQFHTLAHHEPDRPGELWTPPDRQLHRRRRRVLDEQALPAAA